MNAITTTHNLDFETKPFRIQIEGEPMNICFKVGTCHGMYCVTEKTYDIIAIENDEKGNGHLQDVFEWFENSCKRDKKDLRVLEFMNEGFKKHLIEKRGFMPQGRNDVIKYFPYWSDELKQKSFPHILILDEPFRPPLPLPSEEKMKELNSIFESAKRYNNHFFRANNEPIIDNPKDINPEPPAIPSKPKPMGIIGGVIGTSSMGKTAFVMAQVEEARKKGMNVLIVPPTSDYHELMAKLKTASVPKAKEAEELLASYVEQYSKPAKSLPITRIEPIESPMSGKEARRERRKKERDAKKRK